MLKNGYVMIIVAILIVVDDVKMNSKLLRPFHVYFRIIENKMFIPENYYVEI